MQVFFLAADEKYTHFINILEGWNYIDLNNMVQSQKTERIMRLLLMELLDGNKVVCLCSVTETAFSHNFWFLKNPKVVTV